MLEKVKTVKKSNKKYLNLLEEIEARDLDLAFLWWRQLVNLRKLLVRGKDKADKKIGVEWHNNNIEYLKIRKKTRGNAGV